MKVLRGLAITAVLSSLSVAPAAAQTPRERIAAGYELLHAGDPGAASRYFETLLQATPNDLAVRFGWLMAERDRIDFDAARTPPFEKALDAIIDLAGTRYGRTTKDAEALFYLAHAHLLRAAFRFDHDRGMWGAARDGASAKSYIDKYVKEYPADPDGYFALGTYNYFAEILPTFFKVVRFFLFIPAGNRIEGLKQIERATKSVYFGPMSRLMLMDIYNEFEGRQDEAIKLGESLHSQYPASDEAARALAQVYAGPSVEDHARAAQLYGAIAARHRSATSAEGRGRRYRALFAQAGQLQERWRTEDAIALLTTGIAEAPADPAWVLPQLLLRRGNLRALLNEANAGDDARRVLNESKDAAWRKGATDQLAWIDQRRASGEAARYASLIPANRLVADGQWQEARRLYDAIRAREPQNLNVQYRLAVLDFLSGLADRAAGAFAQLAANRSASSSMRSMSLMYTGRVHDLAGRRSEAIQVYKQVIDQYEKEYAAGVARTGLLTPYKRRPAATAPNASIVRASASVTVYPMRCSRTKLRTSAHPVSSMDTPMISMPADAAPDDALDFDTMFTAHFARVARATASPCAFTRL
jgi:hypothetical protein